MRIAEIYSSRQGEGELTGSPSVFVRTSGCNLRCHYCDTPHASWHPEGDDMSVDEILQQVVAWDCRHVVLTGGEPMLFAEMLPLCDALTHLKRHVTIETAGTLYLPLACDLMSISPKLSNSSPARSPVHSDPKWNDRHERTRHAPEVIGKLIASYRYQFKFVIETRQDCDEVQDFLERVPNIERSRVWMMPQGTEPAALSTISHWLEPYCRRHDLHFCPRKHLDWYGNRRGV